MKRYLLLFSLSIASLLVSSQTEKFDLSKYKLPDIKRQQLDFYFYSTGEYNKVFQISDNEFYADTLKNKSNQFDGNYNMGYSFYQNSKRVQSSLEAGINGDYSKTKSNSKYYKKDYSDFDNDLTVNYDLKYFFTPANWFVTAAPELYLSNRKTKDREAINESKNLTTETYFKIGGGLGRIEQVQDFRHAILLIEEFDKRGVSKRNISEKEMIELATLISQLKNKRFFDYRKQKEAELIALDSFFVDNGIVDEKSIQYFTGLEDIWSYGDLQVRESGKQALFSIIPGYHFNKNNNDSETNINEDIMINYNLSFISKKPVSIKWQTNYEFVINHSYFRRLQQQNDQLSEKGYNTNAYVAGLVGFYPNTRTYFDLRGSFALLNTSDENILDKEKYLAGLQITTSGYYYISEKLRVGYDVRYSTSKTGIFNSEVENTYYKRLNYSLNLNYAIF